MIARLLSLWKRRGGKQEEPDSDFLDSDNWDDRLPPGFDCPDTQPLFTTDDMNFDKAFDRLIGHEGKFTDNPLDDGNWTGGKQGRGQLRGTKFGIAAASYPHLDIPLLEMDEAKIIYKEDFWDILGDAHPAIKFQAFDAAVNHGHGNAIRILQRAAGVADDGKWGPVSQAALDKMDHNDALLRFLGYRFKFWASLKKFDEFGRGWTNRGADNLLFAAEDN